MSRLDKYGKLYCDCGTKISTEGVYWGVEKCGRCQRLEREAKEAGKK